MGIGDWLARGAADLATGGGYEAYRYLQNQASRGYNTAAGGARQASDWARQFSDEQWRRQMEGLQGAQGAMTPSNAAWMQLYGNMTPSQPGAMEEWYAQNGGKYGDPTQTSAALDSYRQYMGQPMQAQGAYAQMQNYMQQPSSSQGAYDYLKAQIQQGSNGQAAYGAQQQQFRQPGTGEDWYSQNARMFAQPTQATSFYQNYAGQLAGPGRSEGFQVDTSRMGKLQDAQSDLVTGLRGPGYLDKGAAEVGGYYRGANDVQNYAAQTMPQLQQQGQFENWAQSAISGDNPELQRERERGLAQLNQEMARRGHFNSGGANTAIGNYVAEQNAKEFAQKSGLAQQAQQFQLQRLGQGQGLAQGASSEKMGTGSGLQGLFAQQDQSKLGRDQLAAQIMQSQTQQDLAAQQLGLQAAGQSDQAKLARLQGMSGMASQADSSTLAQLLGGMNAAYGAQGLAQSRAMNDINAANTVDQQNLARLMGLNQSANANDANALARLAQQYGMAQGLDQGAMARYGMLGSLSGQEDAQQLARLNAWGTMAGNAQGAQQSRANADQAARDAAMRARLGIDQTNAGLYAQFYGTGGQLSGQAMSDSYNAWANAAQLEGLGQNASAEVPFKVAGTVIDGYKATQGIPSAQTQVPGVDGGSASQMLGPVNYAGPDYGRMLLNQYLDVGAGGLMPGEADALRSQYYLANGLTDPNAARRAKYLQDWGYVT